MKFSGKSSFSQYHLTNYLKSNFRTKQFAVAAVAPLLFTAGSRAILLITGITDGDLTGGAPKSIILEGAAPVADLNLLGVGSANNGGGTDGQEFTLPAGLPNTGDVIVIAGTTASFNFFNDNSVQNFTLLQNGSANINGDDAVELSNNGSVFDVYGDPDTLGDGEA